MSTSTRLSPLESEHKYQLDRRGAEALLSVLATHLALDVYDAHRPLAYARTTYLDTDDLALLAASDSGFAQRVRLREYASAPAGDAPRLTGACFLEYKAVAGSMRRKARVELPAHLCAELHQGAWDPGWFAAALTEEPFATLGEMFMRMSPRITTFYRRASLSDPEKSLRVTIDEGVIYCPPCVGGSAGDLAQPRTMIEEAPTRIVEIKYRGRAPAWLTDALAELNETTEYSKFLSGMKAILAAQNAPRTARMTEPLRVPALHSDD